MKELNKEILQAINDFLETPLIVDNKINIEYEKTLKNYIF